MSNTNTVTVRRIEGVACDTIVKQLLLVHLSLYTKAETLLKGL